MLNLWKLFPKNWGRLKWRQYLENKPQVKRWWLSTALTLQRVSEKDVKSRWSEPFEN